MGVSVVYMQAWCTCQCKERLPLCPILMSVLSGHICAPAYQAVLDTSRATTVQLNYPQDTLTDLE